MRRGAGPLRPPSLERTRTVPSSVAARLILPLSGPFLKHPIRTIRPRFSVEVPAPHDRLARPRLAIGGHLGGRGVLRGDARRSLRGAHASVRISSACILGPIDTGVAFPSQPSKKRWRASQKAPLLEGSPSPSGISSHCAFEEPTDIFTPRGRGVPGLYRGSRHVSTGMWEIPGS